MAGTNNYKLLIEAQLNSSAVQSQITALQNKNKILLNVSFNTNDLSALSSELDKITSKGNKLTKLSIFGDDAGGINKAAIEYLNVNGNIVKTTKEINSNIEIERVTIQDIAKTKSQIEAINQKNLVLEARQADEMGRISQKADEFIAKSKNMQQTPAVQLAVGKAQEIKVAVNDGDISKVRRLNDEFKTMQAGLQGVRGGLRSWTDAMGNALKQTVSYAISTGLLYSAMSQLRQGMQYIIDLNKEMTNIQVLQIEGATTADEVANLAGKYNALAKELGTTTIEVAKGSVEWLFY